MQFSRLLLLTVVLWGALSAAGQVQAGPPEYLILRPPVVQHHGRSGVYPGTPNEVSTHAYSYGYFGAAPRQHWSRHFGYYRNYTQWSAK